MLKEKELRILSSFFPFVNKIYSTKDIENKSSYSHERVHTTLKNLEKQDLVIKQSFGNVNVFKLNIKKHELFLVFLYYMNSLKKELNIGHTLDIDDNITFHSVIYLPNKESLYITKDNKAELRSHIEESEFISKLQADKNFFETIAQSVVLTGYEKFYDLVYKQGSKHHG